MQEDAVRVLHGTLIYGTGFRLVRALADDADVPGPVLDSDREGVCVPFTNQIDISWRRSNPNENSEESKYVRVYEAFREDGMPLPSGIRCRIGFDVHEVQCVVTEREHKASVTFVPRPPTWKAHGKLTRAPPLLPKYEYFKRMLSLPIQRQLFPVAVWRMFPPEQLDDFWREREESKGGIPGELVDPGVRRLVSALPEDGLANELSVTQELLDDRARNIEIMTRRMPLRVIKLRDQPKLVITDCRSREAYATVDDLPDLVLGVRAAR